MRRILFRSCEAEDGRRFAFLTDQPEVEDLFDSGYKVAYKNQGHSHNSELLARWKSTFTVISSDFDLLPESGEIPQQVLNGFNQMVSTLIQGVDVFFCDYNLGVEGDLPMCNGVMDTHRSTDFVLFSCADIAGEDPTVQPYMVSYAAPRYESGSGVAQQHRIYCKTDAFAFSQAINAIVMQRNKDNLSGGHIRSDIDSYITNSPVEADAAQQVINRFSEALKPLSSDAMSEW